MEVQQAIQFLYNNVKLKNFKLDPTETDCPPKQPGSNGFIITASLSTYYYESAINCARSILDFYPEAKIMICTEKELFREEHRSLFDVVDLTSPKHKRGKLYALSRSPYDITAYVDSDCEIQHEDIVSIFEQLGDKDIMMTHIRKYAAAETWIDLNKTEKMTWHCGVFLYNNKELTRSFMKDWWKEYIYQEIVLDTKSWPWDQHKTSMAEWDQYAFYRLYTSEKYSSVQIDKFPGYDARWNFVYLYSPEIELKDSDVNTIIIYHYTLSKEKRNAGRNY